VQRGVQLFLQWAMMQGVAMLLQNRYQRQRLYTRIALGKVPLLNSIFYLLCFFFHSNIFYPRILFPSSCFVCLTPESFSHYLLLSLCTRNSCKLQSFFVNMIKLFFFPMVLILWLTFSKHIDWK